MRIRKKINTVTYTNIAEQLIPFPIPQNITEKDWDATPKTVKTIIKRMEGMIFDFLTDCTFDATGDSRRDAKTEEGGQYVISKDGHCVFVAKRRRK